MPRVNVLTIRLKESVFGGAPVLTEMFDLGPAKWLLDLEWNVGLFPRKQKQNFQWSALYLFRPALELKISIPRHMMLPKSKVLIRMQDGRQLFRLPCQGFPSIFRRTEMLFMLCMRNKFLQVKKKYLLSLSFPHLRCFRPCWSRAYSYRCSHLFQWILNRFLAKKSERIQESRKAWP